MNIFRRIFRLTFMSNLCDFAQVYQILSCVAQQKIPRRDDSMKSSRGNHVSSRDDSLKSSRDKHISSREDVSM